MSTLSTAPRRAWVEHIMGLPVSLHVRGVDAHSDAVGRRAEAVFDELRDVDATFSTYRWDSQISRLNRREIAPAGCGPEVREVIELCRRARLATGGAFDARHLPLPDGGHGLDPSGLVKGWAVERAARHLDDLPDHDYILNAGGDIVVRTATPMPPWRVGIEDPARRGQLLVALDLRAGALATSGTAQRGAHILDPRTGEPATALASATVAGPRLMWADVFATAAVARGPAALAWLEALPEYEALLVDADGEVVTTQGWPK